VTTIQGTSLLPAADAKALCVRSMDIMVDGSLADFESVVHPDAVNHEARDEPPVSRGTGPAAFHATALWLRETFGDLAFEVHQVIADGDLVALHNTMSGRHTGAAVMYDAEGRALRAFPPTGRTFATTQTHWFRLRDGKVIEHWANRDDLGTASQLGWAPPSPAYLLRTALTTRKARRAASRP
jgi:predicted ester cyclase